MKAPELFLSRRDLLKSAVVTAAASFLAGCWPLTRRPAPHVQIPPNAQSPLLTIDAHCHIFNGSDLEVKDFFTHIVWNEKGVLNPVSAAVGAMLEDLVWTGAPNGDEELRMIHKIEASANEDARASLLKRHHDKRYLAARNALLQTSALRSVSLSRTQRLAGPLNETKVASRDEVLAEMHERLQPKHRDTYVELRDNTYSSIRAAARTSPSFSVSNANHQFSTAGALDYLLENFQYRYGAMQDYLSTYSDANTRSVDLMIASMVDYDWWISQGRRPATTLPKQVQVMAEISVVSQGRVHGFAPFDPLREVAFLAGKTPAASRWGAPEVFSSLHLVKDAIENQGCLGVKLYPPMGFAAYGNAGFDAAFWKRDWLPSWMVEPIPSSEDNRLLPIGQRIDDVLERLYSWCCENDVPIMAHSNSSNGAIQEFKDLADPKYWGNVLTHWPNLRISFGHLGGFSDKDNNGKSSEYPSSFIGLMSDEQGKPGVHAYADAGYFSEVLAEDGTLKDRIIAEYIRVSGGKRSVLESRLMYGTDWNLLINVGDIKPYLSDFIKILDAANKATDGYASARFFGFNAVEWIGLRRGLPSRLRVENFYRRRGLDFERNPPVWMQKVDSTPRLS